jgi:hypothetical protein
MEEEMKTFRFINTAEGELPVVGDEVYCQGLPESLKWHRLDEEDRQVFMKNSYYKERIIRRELHPQEMADMIAWALTQECCSTTDEMAKVICSHIQAALEGKG